MNEEILVAVVATAPLLPLEIGQESPNVVAAEHRSVTRIERVGDVPERVVGRFLGDLLAESQKNRCLRRCGVLEFFKNLGGG